MAKKRTKETEPKDIAHGKVPVILGLIGGIFTFLIALIIVIQLSSAGTIELVFGISGLVIGAAIITSSILLSKKEHFKLGSILLMVFSILGLITLQGLIIGPVISLFGAILTHIKK